MKAKPLPQARYLQHYLYKLLSGVKKEGELPMNQEKNENETKKKTTKTKRAAALLGAVLLVLLYAAALVAAIMDNSASAGLFRACLWATIAVPLLIWIYVWLYGKFTGRPNITDSTANSQPLGTQASGQELSGQSQSTEKKSGENRSR